MRKRLTMSLFVVVAALALVAGACGDDDETSSDSTTTTAEANTDRGNVGRHAQAGDVGAPER